MELYLDSADAQEIDAAFRLGFLNGLTTTPTFMHREGVADVDALIVSLAKKVPILQIEALGQTAEDIVSEARRQEALGLNRSTTVYKIPVSMEGVRACKMLTQEGFMVNIHLVYTLQQAYMAMAAGATYICPLVGRLQDQGTDALALVSDCVQAVENYGYSSKIMFSSVRTVEHVRNALQTGAHAITVPWKILQQLTQNHFTDVGTRQFEEHTRLVTVRVSEAMITPCPTATTSMTVAQALVQMTTGGLGAVCIVDAQNRPVGMFTDGDLRRTLELNGPDAVHLSLESFATKFPHTIHATALLRDASQLFTQHRVDQLVVVEEGIILGMLDVQAIA